MVIMMRWRMWICLLEGGCDIFTVAFADTGSCFGAIDDSLSGEQFSFFLTVYRSFTGFLFTVSWRLGVGNRKGDSIQRVSSTSKQLIKFYGFFARVFHVVYAPTPGGPGCCQA